MKKKNIVCVFAHPDDEAFGPSGIIAKWAEKNNVYIICVTDGSNPNSGNKELKYLRKEELIASAKILGVKKVFFLNYCDGELYNNIYHKVADDIQKIMEDQKPETVLTFELKGVSGHIDHVFVSMVTTFLFNKLDYIKKLYYWCLPKHFSENMENYFIYCPDGYENKDVQHVEDVSSVWDKKIMAIDTHKSQKHDADFVLRMINELPKEELFFLKEK